VANFLNVLNFYAHDFESSYLTETVEQNHENIIEFASSIYATPNFKQKVFENFGKICQRYEINFDKLKFIANSKLNAETLIPESGLEDGEIDSCFRIAMNNLDTELFFNLVKYCRKENHSLDPYFPYLIFFNKAISHGDQKENIEELISKSGQKFTEECVPYLLSGIASSNDPSIINLTVKKLLSNNIKMSPDTILNLIDILGKRDCTDQFEFIKSHIFKLDVDREDLGKIVYKIISQGRVNLAVKLLKHISNFMSSNCLDQYKFPYCPYVLRPDSSFVDIFNDAFFTKVSNVGKQIVTAQLFEGYYNAYLTKQLQKYEIFDNVQEALESDEFVNTHLMPSILDIHDPAVKIHSAKILKNFSKNHADLSVNTGPYSTAFARQFLPIQENTLSVLANYLATGQFKEILKLPRMYLTKSTTPVKIVCKHYPLYFGPRNQHWALFDQLIEFKKHTPSKFRSAILIGIMERYCLEFLPKKINHPDSFLSYLRLLKLEHLEEQQLIQKARERHPVSTMQPVEHDKNSSTSKLSSND